MVVTPGKHYALALRKLTPSRENGGIRMRAYTYKVAVVTDEICPVQNQGRQGELSEEFHGLHRGFVTQIIRLAKISI